MPAAPNGAALAPFDELFGPKKGSSGAPKAAEAKPSTGPSAPNAPRLPVTFEESSQKLDSTGDAVPMTADPGSTHQAPLPAKKPAMASFRNMVGGGGHYVRNLVSRPLASLGFKSFRPNSEAAEEAAQKARLKEDFVKLRGGRTHIQLPSFAPMVQVGNEAFLQRLFDVLDEDHKGVITADALVDKLWMLQRGGLRERINFVFDLMDTQRVGRVTYDQVASMLKISCKESNIRANEAEIRDMTDKFFAGAGRQPPHDGDTLSKAEFAGLLAAHEDLLKNVNLIVKLDGKPFDVNKARAEERTEAQAAVKALPWPQRVGAQFLQRFRVENPQYDFWIFIFTLGQIAGFVVRFLQTDQTAGRHLAGWSYPIAKASAGAIQVVMILLFFPLCRTLLTLLRTTPARHVVPVDDNLPMHRWLAYCLAFWSAMHTIAHLNNANNIGDPSRYQLWLAFSNGNPHQPTVAQFYGQETQVTGILMCAAMIGGYLFALRWPRTSNWLKKTAVGRVLNNFNAFFWTHRVMALVMVVLLIIHPYPGNKAKPHKSTTWIYMLPGLVIFLLERMIRKLRQAFWSTDVVGVRILPGDVTELKLKKPHWARGGFYRPFHYKPGQYCFLMVPSLSRFEWHPFSITSAPSDPFVSFHIRAAGDWTKALRKLMAKTIEDHAAAAGAGQAGLDAAEKGMPLAQVSNPKADALDADVVPDNIPLMAWPGAPVVCMDGPYGAPAQDIEDFEVMLLVGGGIGVTPLVSVIRSLVKEYENSLCKVCKTPHAGLFKPKKVYFYWTVQEQTAPTYFKSTLEAITTQFNCKDFLDIHIHLTKVLPENDMRVTLARVAQALSAEGGDTDISGIKGVQSEFGRPKWDKVFQTIKQKHPGKVVGVFVCGPEALSAQLKGLSKKYSDSVRPRREHAPTEPMLAESSTLFVFHKENF